jgi:hypothetical protein
VQEPSGARGRILAAGDNCDAADAMAMLLEISGFEVRVAHTGADALEPWGGKNVFLLAITGWGQEED